ncbi:MAG: hypothetical protein R6U63_09455 [Longimicrobiales bacterium]
MIPAARNEIDKVFRNLGFLSVFLLYTAALGVIAGQSYLEAHARGAAGQFFAAPEGVLFTIRHLGVVGLFVGSTLIVLSIANDLAWGTLRQEVANGLRRGEYLFGKALLVCVVAALVTLCNLAVGGVFASMATTVTGSPGHLGLALIAKSAGMLAVGVIGCSAIGALFAFVVRSPGLAVVLWVAYFWGGERLFGQMVGAEGALPVEGLKNAIPALLEGHFNAAGFGWVLLVTAVLSAVVWGIVLRSDLT